MYSTKWRELLCRVSITALISSASFVQAYTWPNPKLEELDSQLYDRRGYNERGLSAGMTPDCGSFIAGRQTGRANVADWVRTAYHDMATHNIADGSGGLDASIRFEENRSENVGDGFANTVAFIKAFSNRHFPLADNLAMAAVTAVEMCGGPKIAYRGGRVDATAANSPGVPEPQQTLDEHIASFSRQGFTPEEMIGLVACGHSFGGVQNVAFPEIVDPSTDPQNTSGNAPFDTTFTQFDNKVVTEYLDGTTANPLVVGHNVSTRSDFRIFNSDNNNTMSKFADASMFRSTCASLFARMIDTVPSCVKLTEVVEPLEVKPVAVQLTWVGNGNLQFRGEVRFWDMQENPQRRIKLFWKGRDGKASPDFTALLSHDVSHTTNPLVPDAGALTSLWYDIPSVLVNSRYSVSSFWFEVDEGNGSPKLVNQGGAGYPIQDVVMIANTTCLDVSAGPRLSLKFAIRSDIHPSRIYIKFDDFDTTGAPILNTTDLTVTPTNAVAGYKVQSALTNNPQRSWTLAIDAHGKTYETAYIPLGTSFNLGTQNVPRCL